jgi:AraC-like DNA-binding protein
MSSDLSSLVMRHATGPGAHQTALPALQILRADAPYARVHSMHKPALCHIVQGTKVVSVGDARLRYGAGQFLFSSVELPVAGEVVEATRARPYLVLALDVDPSLVFELVTATGLGSQPARGASAPGILVGRDPAVSEAFTRLVRCLDDPRDTEVVAPLVTRELVYRLLRGPHAEAVRAIGIADGQTQRIARVIAHLKRTFADDHSTSQLAALAGMSVSSFHAHFRKITRLTPLQYQKELQLHEARRLLRSTAISASEAAYRVGYESASQFSREYARHFGLPPISDVRSATAAERELPARARGSQRRKQTAR